MKIEFWRSALIRAIKTVAQTLLSTITVGQALSDINWITILSISAVAGICSILTSIVTGLPEVSEGELVIEKNEEDIPVVKLNINDFKDGMKVTLRDKTGV
ncbi:MAG: holin [Pseudobutyrivibrio sp.]|nr:holin [Pseudobutyrivibrio sp.]